MSRTGSRGLIIGVPAVALVVMAAGVLVAVRLSSPGSPSSAAASATPTATVEPTPMAVVTPRDARKLWPGAKVPMPSGDYVPHVALDASHVLIADGPRVLSLNTRTSAVQEIAVLPVGKDGIIDMWRGERHLVVLTQVGSIFDSDYVLFVITGSTPGSPVSRISTDEDIFNGQVVGDHLIWSDVDGVKRLPLPGGGPVEQVRGGAGLFLVDWPWVTDGRSNGVPTQRKLVNLETGEVRPIVHAEGVWPLVCGPEWCRGIDIWTGRPVVQHPDGSGLLRLSWPPDEAPPWPSDRGYPGRFLPFRLSPPTFGAEPHSPEEWGVFDAATGAMGRLYGGPAGPCDAQPSVSEGLVTWQAGNAKPYAMNLEAA